MNQTIIFKGPADSRRESSSLLSFVEGIALDMKVDGWGAYGLKRGVTSVLHTRKRRGNLGGGEWLAKRREKLAHLKNSKVEDMGKKERLITGQS